MTVWFLNSRHWHIWNIRHLKSSPEYSLMISKACSIHFKASHDIFYFCFPNAILFSHPIKHVKQILKFQTWTLKFSYWKDSQGAQHNEGNYTHSKVYHHKILVHWGKREHLISFKTEYILMTVSLLAGSSRVPSAKINICNISEFLTNFIPQSARSKYLNIGPCY